MSRRLSLLGLLGAGLIVVGAMTGCASGAASAPSSAPPTQPDATASAEPSPVEAGWLNGGGSIALVTWGSSSCVVQVTEEPAVADGVLTVDLADRPGTECTRDMVPRPTLVSLPEGIDATADLEISVTGVVTGKTTLPGLADAVTPPSATDFAPSAGWIGDSLVAILTYGSSSCPPSVETVAAQGDSIAVGFATPPADQVCTLDIAPRVSLADVSELGETEATSLILSGGDVTVDGPVSIIGTR